MHLVSQEELEGQEFVLGKWLGAVRVPAIREFSSASAFRRGMKAFDIKNKDKEIFPFAGLKVVYPENQLYIHELQRGFSDEDIFGYIHASGFIRAGFAHIRYILDMHRKGEADVITLELDDGYPNIFYALDADRLPWGIDVSWSKRRSAWEFEASIAHKKNSEVRIAGSRVFF